MSALKEVLDRTLEKKHDDIEAFSVSMIVFCIMNAAVMPESLGHKAAYLITGILCIIAITIWLRVGVTAWRDRLAKKEQ